MRKDLQRFIDAQENTFDRALSEIKSGRKTSHWMWFIFPQYAGLGTSDYSKTFAIQDIQEANDFLNHPVLGYRLKQISQELLLLDGEDASKVFSFDRVKLRSSMTLFAEVDCSEEKIFIKVLNKYFNGEADQKTLELINNNNRAIV